MQHTLTHAQTNPLQNLIIYLHTQAVHFFQTNPFNVPASVLSNHFQCPALKEREGRTLVNISYLNHI